MEASGQEGFAACDLWVVWSLKKDCGCRLFDGGMYSMWLRLAMWHLDCCNLSLFWLVLLFQFHGWTLEKQACILHNVYNVKWEALRGEKSKITQTQTLCMIHIAFAGVRTVNLIAGSLCHWLGETRFASRAAWAILCDWSLQLLKQEATLSYLFFFNRLWVFTDVAGCIIVLYVLFFGKMGWCSDTSFHIGMFLASFLNFHMLSLHSVRDQSNWPEGFSLQMLKFLFHYIQGEFLDSTGGTRSAPSDDLRVCQFVFVLSSEWPFQELLCVLTHCGWGGTLECMLAAKPVICDLARTWAVPMRFLGGELVQAMRVSEIKWKMPGCWTCAAAVPLCPWVLLEHTGTISFVDLVPTLMITIMNKHWKTH